MAKVITFSTHFPSWHPRRGEYTCFQESIVETLNYSTVGLVFHYNKSHTIRAGKRWKVGDMASLRVWTGKPYRSKQEKIWEDIKIVKVWDFEILPVEGSESPKYLVDGKEVTFFKLAAIAHNDGLTIADFVAWFRGPKQIQQPFSGQIICWHENINY